MPKRIESVIELAKYRAEDIVYWLTIRPLVSLPILGDEDKWKENHHPKVLYKGKLWPHHAKLPRLHHEDFDIVVNLLRSEIIVEEFEVCNVIRSKDTGEFFYSNHNDEWMPESNLFDTGIAARKEKNRIKKMIGRWAND